MWYPAEHIPTPISPQYEAKRGPVGNLGDVNKP